MRAAGAKVLSIDAGRTLIFDREAFFSAANDARIAIHRTVRAGCGGTFGFCH